MNFVHQGDNVVKENCSSEIICPSSFAALKKNDSSKNYSIRVCIVDDYISLQLTEQNPIKRNWQRF